MDLEFKSLMQTYKLMECTRHLPVNSFEHKLRAFHIVENASMKPLGKH